MNLISLVLGVIGVIFRIWLAEFKLAEELQFRRHYLSRLVNIYFFLGMVFNFENGVLNIITIVCFPVMIITTLWDSNFYRMFKTRSYWNKNHGWIILERFTLHPPMLIGGAWMYIAGVQNYLPVGQSFFPYLIGVMLVFIPYFLIDERWTAKYNWPQAVVMISMMILSTTIVMFVDFLILQK
jgi:hypothetical protein